MSSPVVGLGPLDELAEEDDSLSEELDALDDVLALLAALELAKLDELDELAELGGAGLGVSCPDDVEDELEASASRKLL